ncbi:MAG: dienelactone hydrolase family protein [Pseudomonadota bacterium]|nr:dienelactone hydrolase family protein [Pseudomonadota bacterium]
MRCRHIIVALALMHACGAALGAAPLVERVSFASFDLDGHGEPLMLRAMLFRPAGSQGKRIPAVIALHGCGGMYSVVKSRRDELSVRHQKMAELLVDEGYAVLFPDSFRSRGTRQICTQLERERTIRTTHRRLDVLASLAYLQDERTDVAGDRIAVLGWSHGGSTLLASVNANAPAVQRFRDSDRAPFFRSAIAFYPGCVDSENARPAFEPAAALLMLVGASDDWTSPRPCIRLAERLNRGVTLVSIVVYPDTYHGFDGPSTQPRVRLDVPNGVNPGKGVTVAVNAVAREDAYARMKAFLRETLTQ